MHAYMHFDLHAYGQPRQTDIQIRPAMHSRHGSRTLLDSFDGPS